MRVYVFEGYTEKGYLPEKIFLNREEAEAHCESEWYHLCDADKNKYKTEAMGTFHVFECDLTEKELEEYNEGESELVLYNDRWTADCIDMLKQEK